MGDNAELYQIDDPEWIKDIAYYPYINSYYNNNIKRLSHRDKKLLLKLFYEYRKDGLPVKGALKKAKLVFESFDL